MSNAKTAAPLDGAAQLATMRAVLVAKIEGFLGPSREVDAERLADRMMQASHQLYEAGLPLLAGADEVLQQRVNQFNARAWQIALQILMDSLALATVVLTRNGDHDE